MRMTVCIYTILRICFYTFYTRICTSPLREMEREGLARIEDPNVDEVVSLL